MSCMGRNGGRVFQIDCTGVAVLSMGSREKATNGARSRTSHIVLRRFIAAWLLVAWQGSGPPPYRKLQVDDMDGMVEEDSVVQVAGWAGRQVGWIKWQMGKAKMGTTQYKC